MPKTMAVVIDHQNVHLSGAELFRPGAPIENSLIEPFRFASRLAIAKNASLSPGAQVTLKHRWDLGNGIKVPNRASGREKGIEVMCALVLGRLARSGHYDVVVLAS